MEMTQITDIHAGKGKQKTLTIIVIVISIVVIVGLIALGYCLFLSRKEGKNHHDILKESCNEEKHTFFSS
jgi:flagellar basal body-associated protein FliL